MEVTVLKKVWTELEIPDELTEEQVIDAVKEQISDMDIDDWDEQCYYGTEVYEVSENSSGVTIAEFEI